MFAGIRVGHTITKNGPDMNAALLRKTFKVFIFNSFRKELWRKSQSVRGRKGKTF